MVGEALLGYLTQMMSHKITLLLLNEFEEFSLSSLIQPVQFNLNGLSCEDFYSKYTIHIDAVNKTLVKIGGEIFQSVGYFCF